MNKIRTGVFETNSSSTHVCILATSDTIKDWKNGELVYIDYLDKDIMSSLPKDAFVDDDFLKEEYFDKVVINSNCPHKITFKNMLDLWDKKKAPEDIWGTAAEEVVKEIKSHSYYYDDDDDDLTLGSNDILDFLDCEYIGLYSYDMLFDKYTDLEYNMVSKNLNGCEVDVLSWDGYEG